MYISPNLQGDIVKINDSLKPQVDLTPTNQPVKSDRTDVKPEVSPTPSHTVQISNLSTQLQAMQNAQASGAVFESKKVEEIKAANF